MKNKKKAFTLVELSVVVILLTLFFMIVIPNIEKISPKFQLRSLGRIIGSTLESARSEAIISNAPYGINYNFSKQTFGLLLPANFGLEKKFISHTKREVIFNHKISSPLSLESLIFPDGTQINSGEKNVEFDSFGKKGSHIVIIKTDRGKKIWVKFNSIAGTVTYSSKELIFQKYEGS